MNVLIVGAGAVGQVYGRHLAAGGARVTFFVRPRYVEELRGGMCLYPLNERRRDEGPVRFEDFGLLTTYDEVGACSWDQVWLCVSSTALRAGWLDELIAAVGDATMIALQPGPEDRSFLLERIPKERLVHGMISLISYPAPLPGEDCPEPGMAYWFPPLSPSPFSGEVGPRDEVIAALKRGGQPAASHSDVVALAGFPSAVLMSLLVGLEAEGWRFGNLARGEFLRRSIAAAREAILIVARHHGVRPPWWRYCLSPLLVKALLAVAPWVVPLPLETYLGFHFTKVGDQTRLYMDTYAALGRTFGLPTDSLEALSEEASRVQQAA